MEGKDNMDWYFKQAMEKLEKLSEEYDNYSELEKLDKLWYVNDCFEKIFIDCNFTRYNNHGYSVIGSNDI